MLNLRLTKAEQVALQFSRADDEIVPTTIGIEHYESYRDRFGFPWECRTTMRRDGQAGPQEWSCALSDAQEAMILSFLTSEALHEGR